MSGHAYSGEDLNKIRHACVYNNGEFKKLRKAWYYKNGVYRQVWSGASEVNYYDGNTLLGVEEVDEGESVLHPSFSTTKQGYTLVAWKDALYGDPLDELLATGEPMRVYALYVPNTLQVVSCDYLSWYNGAQINSEYVKGKVACGSWGTRRWWQTDDSGTFTLDMKWYQNNSIEVRESNAYSVVNFEEMDSPPDSYGRFDGVHMTKNSSIYATDISNGDHSVYVWGHTVDYDIATNTQMWTTYVKSLVLSNPTPWT